MMSSGGRSAGSPSGPAAGAGMAAVKQTNERKGEEADDDDPAPARAAARAFPVSVHTAADAYE